MGHVISENGVAVDPRKVECVKSWPTPRCTKGVQGFLGLTDYYRNFIQGYGKIAKALTELLKKNNFRWTHEAQRAFDRLKEALSTGPVLSQISVNSSLSNVMLQEKGLGHFITRRETFILF